MADQKFTDEDLINWCASGRPLAHFAKDYGADIRTVQRRKKKLLEEGKLFSPIPQKVSGVSTLMDAEGNTKLQWVKTVADSAAEKMEIYKQAFTDYAEGLQKVAPVEFSSFPDKDLLAVYPLGDPHVGMLAWAEETGGENWDLEIATEVLCKGFGRAVLSAPSCKKALIVNLGDFFHYDNQEGMTQRSKNILDRDGRYAKMVKVGLRIIRFMIEVALSRHEEVEVINVIGNHDETGALFLSIALSHIYENEPRIKINTSPSLFHYMQFGKVLLGAHHGHTCKMEKLPSVMAAERYMEWGDTKYRYWLTGHIHHDSMKEYPGCKVESFRTLAAKDAYAASGGWISGRDTKAIIYHKEYGEVERHTINFEMLK